jgi:hypothetical protein
MKKIICLIGLIGLMQNGFAKMHPYGHYYNYTQNVGTSCICFDNYLTANPGDSVLLDAYLSGPMGVFWPVQWFFNGDSISNTTLLDTISIIVNQAGIYVAYFDGMFGTGNISFNVNITTGIPSIKNINFLNIFPTAVTSSITIQLNSIKTNDVEISFFDMHGRQLKNDFYKNIVGEYIKNENTEALAKGIYFLRIKAGEDVMEKKFVKM